MYGADAFDTLPAAETDLNHRAIASRIGRLPLGRSSALASVGFLGMFVGTIFFGMDSG